MAKIAARGPRLPDGARAASPPGGSPLILLAGNPGSRLEAVGKALGRRGPSVRVVTFVEAEMMLGSARPDLLVVYGQDAENQKLERLIRAAGQVPSAVLGATREQRQTLRELPPGSVLVVPPSDSEEIAIQRLAQLATDLARRGGRLEPSDLPGWSPAAPSVRPSSRADRPSAPTRAPVRSRPPPAAEDQGWADGAEAPTLPRPSNLPTLPRIVTSAPPPPGRAATAQAPRSLPPPAPSRTHSTPSPATSTPPPPPARTRTPPPSMGPSNPPPPPVRTHTPAPMATSAPPSPPARTATPAPARPSTPPLRPARSSPPPAPRSSTPPPPPQRSSTPPPPAPRSSTPPPRPARSSSVPPPSAPAADETPIVEEPWIPKFGDIPQVPAFGGESLRVSTARPPPPSSISPALVSAATFSRAPPRRRRNAGPWLVGLAGLVLVGAGAAAIAWIGWPRVSSTLSSWVPGKVHSSAPGGASQGVTAPAAPSPSAAPLPTGSAVSGASSAAPTAPAPPPADGIVEAQVDTPSCESLLEGFPAEPKPPPALAQVKRAVELLRVRRLDDAQRVYCRAIADHPSQAAPRLALLELLLRRHDNQAVVGHARQAMQASPQETQFAWILGDGLARRGQWAQARAVWLGPSAGQPEEPQRVRVLARQNLNAARAAARPGYHAQAECAFRRVAILDPTDVEASTGVAQSLLHGDDPKAAAAWAQHALRRAPRYAALHVMLGNALAAAGDPEGARAAWGEALKLDAGNREALTRLRRAPR